MGDEISDTKFSAEVFEEFRNRLDMETVILQSWIDEGKLRCDRPWAGCELEAWLTDGDGNPAPNNDELLSKLDNKPVVPELAKFNIELNTEPLAIESGFLETMHSNLLALWQDCERTALSQGRSMTMIGILPSVTQSDLA
jgi:hypothetical protein